MALDFSKILNWLVTLCCGLTKEFSFFTKQSWNPTTKILTLKFPNHGFIYIKKPCTDTSQLRILKHLWNFGQITDPNLTLGNPLSFSSWTTTESSKKSTVNITRNMHLFLYYIIMWTMLTKFVAHSLFNWGALMILKNPDVNILFDDVCIIEQICIVLDGPLNE